MKKFFALKLLIGLFVVIGITIATPLFVYLKVLPYAVSNPKVINYVQKSAKKYAKVDLTIKNPVLVTSLTPIIDFKVEDLALLKNNKKLFALKNFDSEFSFKEIFDKNIIVNKLTAKYIFADVNGLMSLAPQQKNEKKKAPEWDIDLFDSLLRVEHCLFLYSPYSGMDLKIMGRNLEVNNSVKTRRFVHFDFITDINKNNSKVHLAIKDDNKIFIENKAIYVEDCPLTINNSKMFFNADADKKKNFHLEIFTKNFDIQDVIKLMQTQIVENNLDDVLQYFENIKGRFDFDLKMSKNKMDGVLDLKNISFNIVPVDRIPITLQKGHITLDDKNMKLSDFEGYYDNKQTNNFKFGGTVNDYLHSIDTDIKAHAVASNDFFKNHLSAMVDYPIELTGNADAFVKLKSKNNIIDVNGLFIVPRGKNITIGGDALPFEDTIRALTTDLHFANAILDIKSIKYYMEAKYKERDARRPIFALNGQVDTAKNNYVNKIGFEIPDPLPSEFINALIKQHLFKKGTVSGKLSIDNTGKYPILDGKMHAEKIRIPSQRIFIKAAELNTTNDLIHLNAHGKYKRAAYKFNGDIENAIKYPIVVKDINLNLDYLDVYKALQSQNTQQTTDVEPLSNSTTDDMGDGKTDFDISNLIIEKCLLSLNKGAYKDINFANLNANMTLDKNSILKLDSNKFEIAEGHSSIKVNCDLKKHKYHVLLGIKDVNSDLIATNLLELKREISGKASGLIDLNTDDSLKLNGSIKFLIANGTIQKVGLVEYVLKFAALFRNPLTMISPSTFSDLVNIPEGNFDKITGNLTLKDNVITLMKIKSYSPQLSSYIVGRYDLESKDATLRIYTKFSSYKKGFAGALRSFSLNSLANRIPMSSRNDANYYSSELSELPPIEADEKNCQIFLTKVDGDIEHNNFLSSLKKIK